MIKGFWQPILLGNGILLTVLAGSMLIPLLFDYLSGNEGWQDFAMSSIITAFAGMTLYLTNRGYEGRWRVRQAFLFTVVSYCSVIAFGALPLYLAVETMSAADAVFESASGLTTTGSTVMTGLDTAPPGLLLWRALLNGMGGIGIVVMGIAILPMLRIGGMQLFRTESSDNMDKMLPRTNQIAVVITYVFLSLTGMCTLAYWMAGMDLFDAICHALPTIATGGFSTHDASFAYYDSPLIELAAIIFMTAGSLPLILYYQSFRGQPVAFWRDSQVRGFFALVASVILVLTVWLWLQEHRPLLDSLRHVTFNVISIISTTGFASTDYALWGDFATCVFFMITAIGGCTGSTSGGIKIFRLEVLFETTKAQINHLLQPHGVFLPYYNGKPISDEVVSSVMSFIMLWGLIFVTGSMALSFFELDFLTALSAVSQAMANVGPGLGEIIGPAGNFKSLPDGAKWLLSLLMVLGRVEIFTFIVLLSPRFWRE